MNERLSSADRRRVIVALDVEQPSAALQICEQLDPASCRVKVGLELFSAGGTAVGAAGGACHSSACDDRSCIL